MAKEENESKWHKKWGKPVVVNKSGGAIYGLGIIGTAIYYIQHASSFWIGVIGIIKAIFWPAILLYKVFDLLKL
jgi:hypothetical protein